MYVIYKTIYGNPLVDVQIIETSEDYEYLNQKLDEYKAILEKEEQLFMDLFFIYGIFLSHTDGDLKQLSRITRFDDFLWEEVKAINLKIDAENERRKKIFEEEWNKEREEWCVLHGLPLDTYAGDFMKIQDARCNVSIDIGKSLI